MPVAVCHCLLLKNRGESAAGRGLDRHHRCHRHGFDRHLAEARLDCRVGVAEEPTFPFPSAEEGRIHGERATLKAVDPGDVPRAPLSPRDDGELPDLALKESSLVERRGKFAPEVERRILLGYLVGTAVPEEELPSARVDARKRELVGKRVLDAPVVPARRVVAWSIEEARERQCAVVRGIRHLLVAADALNCHYVRIRLLDSRQPVLVVDVDKEFPIRRGRDRVRHPFAPLLIADVDKPVLHALHAPLDELVEDRVAVFLERLAVYVEYYADVLLLRIAENLEEVKFLALRDTLRRKAGLERIADVLLTVPSAVELDVLHDVALHEVHRRLAAVRVELRDAQHLARLDPARVSDARRRVQRIHERRLRVRKRRSILRHVDVTPRRDIRHLYKGLSFENSLHRSGLLAAREADARIVEASGVADCGDEAWSFHDERTLRRAGEVRSVVVHLADSRGDRRKVGTRPHLRNGRKRLRDVLSLRMRDWPAPEIRAEVEHPSFVRDAALAHSVEADSPCDGVFQIRRLDARALRKRGERDVADLFARRTENSYCGQQNNKCIHAAIIPYKAGRLTPHIRGM